MTKLRARLLGLWFAAIYIAASAMAGFSHAPIVTRDAAPAIDLSAYVLPDGTVPVICINAPADGDAPQAGGHRACDACLLTAAPGLCASPAEIAEIDVASIRISPPLVTADIRANAEFRPNAPRGPPAA